MRLGRPLPPTCHPRRSFIAITRSRGTACRALVSTEASSDLIDPKSLDQRLLSHASEEEATTSGRDAAADQGRPLRQWGQRHRQRHGMHVGGRARGQGSAATTVAAESSSGGSMHAAAHGAAWHDHDRQSQQQHGAGVEESLAQQTVVPGIRAAKSVPVVRISREEPDIGNAAGHIKKSLVHEGSALVVCGSEAALWHGFRALRCAHSMLRQDERTIPVFQPVTLRDARNGLRAGTTILYTEKIMAGQFNVSSLLRVTSPTPAEGLAKLLVDHVLEHGSCVLESQGRAAAVRCIQVIELARRKLWAERLDVATALDSVLVEVAREDIQTTMRNRFVVLQCTPKRPGQLQVKVSMRMRASSRAV